MNSCSVESSNPSESIPDPFSDSERPGGWFRFLTFWEREEGGLKRVETYFGINPEFQTSLNRISTESIQFSHFEFSRQEIKWKLYENRETVKILKSHTIWVIWTKIIWNWYFNLERIQKFKFLTFWKV